MSRHLVLLGSEIFIGSTVQILNALAGDNIFPLYPPHCDMMLRDAAQKECVIHFRNGIESGLLPALPPEIRGHIVNSGNPAAPAPLKLPFKRLHSLLPAVDTNLTLNYAPPFTLMEVFLPLPGLNREIEILVPDMMGGGLVNKQHLLEKIEGSVWCTVQSQPLSQVDKENLKWLKKKTQKPIDVLLLQSSGLPEDEETGMITFLKSKLQDLVPEARIVKCNPSEAMDAQVYGFSSKLKSSGILEVRELINSMIPDPKAEQKDSTETDLKAGGKAAEKPEPPEAPGSTVTTAQLPEILAEVGDFPRTIDNLQLIKKFYTEMTNDKLPACEREVKRIIEECKGKVMEAELSFVDSCREYASHISSEVPRWLNGYTLIHRNSISLMLVGGAKIFGREAHKYINERERLECQEARERFLLPAMQKKFSRLIEQIASEVTKALDIVKELKKWIAYNDNITIPEFQNIHDLCSEKFLKEILTYRTLFGNTEAINRMESATARIDYNQKNPASHAKILHEIGLSASIVPDRDYTFIGQGIKAAFTEALNTTLSKIQWQLTMDISTISKAAAQYPNRIEGALSVLNPLQPYLK